MLLQKDFHVFRKDDRHFLFLTQPVAVFAIDGDTWRVLEQRESGDTPHTEADRVRVAEVEEFVAGYLDRAKPTRPLRAPGDITDKVIALYLFVCQECNLQCSYCYGDAGEYGKRGHMTETVLHSTFERFFADGHGQHFVTFFGGEPLMNFPLMEKTAALAETYRQEGKADVGLSIVTNGTLYNEKIDAFFRRHITDVTFSLDGPRELNDTQRISKSGVSVHDRAWKNIRKLTDNAPFGWAFRSIVTSHGCERVQEIYDHFEKLKPGGIGIVDVDAPKDSPLRIDDEQYGRFLEQIIAINRRALTGLIEGEQPVAFEYPFFILYYFVSRCHALYHCNAGTNLLAVTAEGDVYPCHRFVGIDRFRMGNVADPGLKSSERYREIRNLFIDTTVDRREGCRDCWARYLCGGSCVKHSFSEHGRIEPPVARHCRYIKAVVEELLPDLVSAIEVPDLRRKLVARLGEAVGGRRDSRTPDEAHVA
jgi:uncharacterized protein